MSELILNVTLPVIAFAALLYLVKELRLIATEFKMKYRHHHIKKVEDIFQKVAEQIEIDFDLWWSDEPAKSVRNKLKEMIVVSADLPENIPSEVLEGIMAQTISGLRHDARLLAIHAGSREDMCNRIERSPVVYGIRRTLTEWWDGHIAQIEESRGRLVKGEVDVNLITDRFSPV